MINSRHDFHTKVSQKYKSHSGCTAIYNKIQIFLPDDSFSTLTLNKPFYYSYFLFRTTLNEPNSDSISITYFISQIKMLTCFLLFVCLTNSKPFPTLLDISLYSFKCLSLNLSKNYLHLPFLSLYNLDHYFTLKIELAHL